MTTTGRRGFLGRVGAVGLAVAAATFGGRTATAAPGTQADCKCCNLEHCPPNIDYYVCIANAEYSWRCYYTDFGYTWQCNCCETRDNAQSAFACWPR